MYRQRPERAKGFVYQGYQRYFLTICTAKRCPAFEEHLEISWMLDALRDILAAEGFALLAYCFMPDHVHLLLEGLGPEADLCLVVPRWKQLCGYRYRRKTGRPLWQSGYYDRVLRNDESSVAVARYILENPVHAGLAKSIGDYPFAGSDVWSLSELIEVAKDQR